MIFSNIDEGGWGIRDPTQVSQLLLARIEGLYKKVHMRAHISHYNIDRPCARSDWSKTHVLSEYKAKKKRVSFCTRKIYIIKQNEEAYVYICALHCDKTLRTFENKRDSVAHVFYISLEFSNARHVLSV